jgi:phospholipase/carboxylesterase
MAKANQMKKIGPLETIEIPGKIGGPCIVMMHGYGADARDLVPLANVISAPSGTTWLFPNGPLKVPLSPHMFGQAWFPIDLAAYETARQNGTHLDYAKATPSGIKQMRENVFSMLESKNIPISKTVFAGFSQGAMLATSLSLYAPIAPLGLVIMSGVLLDEKNWSEKAKTRKGFSYFQSHGTHDDILPIEGAQKLETTLTGAGLKGKLQIFDGAHEIPQEVIHGINNYMKSLPW